MAIKETRVCDACGTEEKVMSHSIEYGWRSCPAGGSTEYVSAEADICDAQWASICRVANDMKGIAKFEIDLETFARAVLVEAVSRGVFRKGDS